MIPLSRRHLLPALVLALASAGAVGAASLREARGDECPDPGLLRQTERIPGSVPTRERLDRLGDGVFQWSEGEWPSEVDRSRYAVVRTRRPYALFHQPLENLPMVPERVEREWLDVDGARVPIDVAVVDGGPEAHVVATLYVYDGEPVTRLLPRQLRALARDPLGGTPPLTLFRFDAIESAPEASRSVALARRWLANAWRIYRSTCPR